MSDKYPSPYKVALADIDRVDVTPDEKTGGGRLFIQMACGVDMGLMIARRDQGYHSTPHYHDSEQFNYVLDGEIWFFIDDHGFRCRKGDIIRVPRNAVHWTWVRAEAGCQLLEVHCPPLTGDPKLSEGAYWLLASDEKRDPNKATDNTFIAYDKLAEVERQAFERDPD